MSCLYITIPSCGQSPLQLASECEQIKTIILVRGNIEALLFEWIHGNWRFESVDVYFKDQWEQKMREEEQMKHERLAQLQPTEELSDDEMEKAQESSRSTEVAEDSTLLRLTIRGKDGKDSKMKVKPVSL